MKTLTIGTVQPKQWLFMTDKHRHIAYGGARGGGKSWAVRAKAKLLALRYAGIKILIVRRTMPELRNNHIDQLRQELKGLARYNQTEKIFRFPNGSSIAFGYCAKDNDVYQYQGAEYDVIFLDEAAQLRQEWIEKINACVRGANGFPKRTYYTLNPGGPSHGYFKRLFVDRIFNPDEHPEDYSFIQAKVTDNKELLRQQPDYIRSLENLPPKLRAAWLDGRWDVYEGQFFEDFVNNPAGYRTRQGTHVINPFDIPSGWTICRSYDFGYGKPFSCAWWAVDYDGVIYRILELYGCTQTPNEGVKWTPDRQFAEIAKIERQHPWLKGKDIHGVYFSKGDNERIAGWMQCHYRLQFDENGYPRMYVFRTCEAFIRTIPILVYDEHKVEDLDTGMEDHCADEWRYFCMSRPVQPLKEAPAQPVWADPLNQMRRC